MRCGCQWRAAGGRSAKSTVRSRRARPGALEKWKSGNLASWDDDRSSPGIQVPRLLDSQVPRTPERRPPPNPSRRPATFAPRQAVEEVRVPAPGSVAPSARFGFGSARTARKPLTGFGRGCAMARFRRAGFGIGSVRAVRSAGAGKRRLESSAFAAARHLSLVLLIRRSLVRVQVGEPENSRGCARAARPLFRCGRDHRMKSPRVTPSAPRLARRRPPRAALPRVTARGRRPRFARTALTGHKRAVVAPATSDSSYYLRTFTRAGAGN